MMDTERPIMGQVLGGLVGFAVGGAAGMFGTTIVSVLLPGVGPVLAIGTVAAALGAVAGTTAGVEVGSVFERALTTGIPKDEVFVYEDALRKGRTVLIALAEDQTQIDAAHRMLEQAGAESIDAARHTWWLGLRSAEEAAYVGQRGDFAADEPIYRRGFEAALHPEVHATSYDDAQAFLREHYADVYEVECFRRGYERGQLYTQTFQEKQTP
jgi:hypothetical protein